MRGVSTTKPWTCSDGSSGTVTFERLERLYLPNIGDLKDCVVLVERGDYHTGAGDERKLVRTTERTIWLAPGLGLVKESLAIKQPDGTTTFQTEATLTRFHTP